MLHHEGPFGFCHFAFNCLSVETRTAIIDMERKNTKHSQMHSPSTYTPAHSSSHPPHAWRLSDITNIIRNGLPWLQISIVIPHRFESIGQQICFRFQLSETSAWVEELRRESDRVLAVELFPSPTHKHATLVAVCYFPNEELGSLLRFWFFSFLDGFVRWHHMRCTYAHTLTHTHASNSISPFTQCYHHIRIHNGQNEYNRKRFSSTAYV